jgi:hypothetical protein
MGRPLPAWVAKVLARLLLAGLGWRRYCDAGLSQGLA